MPVAKKAAAARPAPQDHLPKKTAQQREVEAQAAGDTLVVLNWRDHELTIDSDPTHLTGRAMLAFETTMGASAIRGVLGAEQWSLVQDYTITELSELGDMVARALGFTSAGESAASSD